MASVAATHKTSGKTKDQQPSNQYIMSILKVLVSIIYTLHWDMENKTHNLVGLLLEEVSYVNNYKKMFPWSTKRPEIYILTRVKTDKYVVHVKCNAAHKANQEAWVLYDVTEKETTQFFTWADLL